MVDTGSTLQGMQRFLQNGLSGYKMPSLIASPVDDVPVVITSGLAYDIVNELYYMGLTGSTWVKLGSIAIA